MAVPFAESKLRIFLAQPSPLLKCLRFRLRVLGTAQKRNCAERELGLRKHQ